MISAKGRFYALVLCAALVVTLLLSLNVGYVHISIWEALKTVFGFGTAEQAMILFSFRLPRLIIAALMGMGLAVSGAILQGITQNPLADAGLMGITAGGGMAVILSVIFVGSTSTLSILTLPVLSFAGACIAALLVYTLAYKRVGGLSKLRLILTGVAIQVGISAVTTVLLIKLDERQYTFFAAWQAGRIWGGSWTFVAALLPWLVIVLPIVLYKAQILDVLGLGDDMALTLGVRVERERRVLLMTAVALAAACVSVGGNITFVGLVAPHISRKLVGARHRELLPISALMGALLVSLADMLSRCVLQPSGLPTGVVTSLIGAPYFIYLLSKMR